VIELLTRVNKASQKLGTKKAIISDGLSTFAPPNIVLSNQFNEELMWFSSIYDNNSECFSLVP
jgi:hypothetical protein